MTTFSRSPITSRFAGLAVWVAGTTLAAGCLFAQAPEPGSFALMKSCSAGAEAAATLHAADPVSVRYSFSGDAGTCYKVIATIDGHSVSGYLIGAAHPAVQAFIHDVQSQAKIIPPPPPPAPPAAAPAAKPLDVEVKPAPAPELPLSFAGFHAVAIDGWPVDLSRERAANVVIYFWSPRTRDGLKAADQISQIYDSFHTRSVYFFGVATGTSRQQLRKAASDYELEQPQVLDGGGIAARYHVDPAKPFLILDQHRNVIAAESSAGALESILAQLTKGRRARL